MLGLYFAGVVTSNGVRIGRGGMKNRYERPGAKFGQLLRDARDMVGISQREMAENTGVPENTLAQWERGNYTNLPDPERFRQMIRGVGLDDTSVLREVGYIQDEGGEEVLDDVMLFAAIKTQVLRSGLSDYTKKVMVNAIEHARELQRMAEEEGGDVSE